MNTGKELRLASWNLLLWIKYDLRKPALGECHTHCIRCVLFTWALPLVTMSQPGNLMIPHEWFFHITLPWGGAFGAGLMSKRKKMRALLYFRIRVVLACNAMFLSLSYSFHYRIIASYHHITASLTASESAICKEGQWYESRVREKWISADTLSKLSCCLYVYGSLKGQCGSSAATKMFDIYK